jgi:hypothetical protein
LASIRGEIGALANSFNRFIAFLNKTVAQLRVSTDTIATASAEIPAGNLDLFVRTDMQVSGPVWAAHGKTDLDCKTERRLRARSQFARRNMPPRATIERRAREPGCSRNGLMSACSKAVPGPLRAFCNRQRLTEVDASHRQPVVERGFQSCHTALALCCATQQIR